MAGGYPQNLTELARYRFRVDIAVNENGLRHGLDEEMVWDPENRLGIGDGADRLLPKAVSASTKRAQLLNSDAVTTCCGVEIFLEKYQRDLRWSPAKELADGLAYCILPLQDEVGERLLFAYGCVDILAFFLSLSYVPRP